MRVGKKYLVLIIICFLCIFSYSNEKVLLRYIKKSQIITYYNGIIENSIPSQPGAKLKLAIKNQRLTQGNIKGEVQFMISTKKDKFGPFTQNMDYDFMGNFKRDKETEERDSSRYIDVAVFFPRFPVDRVDQGHEWKEHKALADMDGNEADVIILNKVLKINGDDNTVEIKSKGLNNQKTYYILRDVVFDYELGVVKSSKVRILNKETTMGQVTSTMEIKSYEKDD